ncbi:MAG: histidine phosphatase family protein, partial [Pseudomonas sp.]|nr:histidine phosphatase family protein [Pseudomonas sp.]
LMETDAEALGLFWADPYSFTPPDGEPVEAFSQRVRDAVLRLHQLYAGQRVLLISHGGVMRLLLAQARGLPREQLLNVEVGHGGLFSLRVEADGVLSEGA